MLRTTPMTRSRIGLGEPLGLQGSGSKTTPTPTPTDRAWLEANSDQPEVQVLIRDAIRDGKIRVRPLPGAPGIVEIVPSAAPAKPTGHRP